MEKKIKCAGCGDCTSSEAMTGEECAKTRYCSCHKIVPTQENKEREIEVALKKYCSEKGYEWDEVVPAGVVFDFFQELLSFQKTTHSPNLFKNPKELEYTSKRLYCCPGCSGLSENGCVYPSCPNCHKSGLCRSTEMDKLLTNFLVGWFYKTDEYLDEKGELEDFHNRGMVVEMARLATDEIIKKILSSQKAELREKVKKLGEIESDDPNENSACCGYHQAIKDVLGLFETNE